MSSLGLLMALLEVQRLSNLNPGSAYSNPREFFIIPSFFTLIMFSAETFAGRREP